MPEDPEIDQMQQYTHISFFFYCKKGEVGGQERSTYKYFDNKRQNIAVKFCTHTKSKKAT